jgi:hypothetical protein
MYVANLLRASRKVGSQAALFRIFFVDDHSMDQLDLEAGGL